MKESGSSCTSNQLNIAYSHMIGSRISIGAGIKLTDTELRRKATEGSPFIPEEILAFGVEAFDVVNRTDTESLGVEAMVGVFARLGAQWTFGAQVGLGWTRSHTTGRSELPPEFEMAPVRVDRQGFLARGHDPEACWPKNLNTSGWLSMTKRESSSMLA